MSFDKPLKIEKSPCRVRAKFHLWAGKWIHSKLNNLILRHCQLIQSLIVSGGILRMNPNETTSRSLGEVAVKFHWIEIRTKKKLLREWKKSRKARENCEEDCENCEIYIFKAVIVVTSTMKRWSMKFENDNDTHSTSEKIARAAQKNMCVL